MASKSKKGTNPGNVEARIQKMRTGLQTLPAGTVLDLQGAGTASNQIVTELTTREAPYLAATKAHQAATEAVDDRNAAEPGTIAYLDLVEAAIKAKVGVDSPELADFGITPKKARKKLTPEERY